MVGKISTTSEKGFNRVQNMGIPKFEFYQKVIQYNIKLSNTLGEILNELNYEGESNKNSSLLILDLPKESELKKDNLTALNNQNQLYVFATTLVANGHLEIKVGTPFDIIFPSKETNKYIMCDVILKYVNVNPRYEIDYLPGGYTGICLLEFNNGIPEIISKLAYYGDKKDYSIHDILILTQKPILTEILKRLNN